MQEFEVIQDVSVHINHCWNVINADIIKAIHQPVCQLDGTQYWFVKWSVCYMLPMISV